MQAGVAAHMLHCASEADALFHAEFERGLRALRASMEPLLHPQLEQDASSPPPPPSEPEPQEQTRIALRRIQTLVRVPEKESNTSSSANAE